MFNFWAIDENAAKMLAELTRTTDIAALSSSSLDMPDPQASVEGNVAIIPIKGILTKEETGGFIRFLMGGGTSYQGIIERVQAAEADPKIESVKYLVDSPGGSANGMFEAAKVIKEASKPSVAVVSGMAASGAYGLASQADKVIASNVADLVGSIGVVQSFFVSENVVDVTSSNAPHKAPNPKTDAGFKAIQEQLDMIEGHFIDTIADGRGTTAKIVRSDYGRGMVLTADVAMRRGMIDAIESEPSASAAADVISKDDKGSKVLKQDEGKKASKTLRTGGKQKMKLSALLADDAEARAEHEAKLTAARQQGADTERTRVKAHLANMSHSGEKVVKAINEGTEYDAAAGADYMNAGMAAAQGQKMVLDNAGKVVTDDGNDALDGDKKAAVVAAAVDTALDGIADDSKAGIFG